MTPNCWLRSGITNSDTSTSKAFNTNISSVLDIKGKVEIEIVGVARGHNSPYRRIINQSFKPEHFEKEKECY